MTNLFVTCDRIGSESGGGIVTHHEVLALQHLGNVDVLNPQPSQDPFEADKQAVAQYRQNNNKYKLAHFYAGTFTELVKALKADGTKVTYTVAAHNIGDSIQAHKDMGMEYNYPHMTEPDLLEKYIGGYKEADMVICPSTHSQKFLASQGILATIIPHGCELGEVKPLPEVFVVGYLGAIGADKGLIHLLKAWDSCNFDDATLMIGGRDSVHLLPLVRQLRGSIHLAGWMDNPSLLYNQCSIYCQASTTEGFSCEVVEAMAHGRPVLCSKGAGASDLISDDVGVVVPARNSFAIASALRALKKRTDLARMGQNAREKAKNYTWDKIRNKYVELWSTLLK